LAQVWDSSVFLLGTQYGPFFNVNWQDLPFIN